MNNIKVPVAAYYANNDWLAAVKDVNHLLQFLPNVIESYIVPHKRFNHIDFTWGIDAPTLVYKRVIELIKSRSFQNSALDDDGSTNEIFESAAKR